jgi:hypothetical protein
MSWKCACGFMHDVDVSPYCKDCGYMFGPFTYDKARRTIVSLLEEARLRGSAKEIDEADLVVTSDGKVLKARFQTNWSKAKVLVLPSEEEKDSFSPIEKDLIRLATPLENFGTIAEAIHAIADARQSELQELKKDKLFSGADSVDFYGVGAETIWQALNDVIEALNIYLTLDEKKQITRESAAIVANIALWLVQATQPFVRKTNEEEDEKYICDKFSERETFHEEAQQGVFIGGLRNKQPNTTLGNTDGMHFYTEGQ